MKTRYRAAEKMQRIASAEMEKELQAESMRQAKPIKLGQWEKIAEFLRVGGDIGGAADFAGVSRGRLQRNIDADKHMSKDIRRIMAECYHHHLERVYDGCRGWQASAWFLERIYRKRFALNDATASESERAIQVRKIVRECGRRPVEEPSAN